jgi:NADH dehydrogenase
MTTSLTHPAEHEPRVVIIGAGFGGLEVAKHLAHAPVRVTLLDRENHHLFQPLLYQVATAGLSPADIASPIRSIVRKQDNTAVLLAEVLDIDLAARTVRLERGTIPYDFLVLAAGATTNYFGHDEWSRIAPPMKSMNDAIRVRRHVLLAFEEAERETNPERRRELLSFVVVGGGPTGVELAGAIAELARRALATDFRSIDPTVTKITLLEAGARVLPTFDPRLSTRAVEQLSELGVETHLNSMVVGVDEHGVDVRGGAHFAAATVVWAAGVKPVPLAQSLDVEHDRAGRIKVLRDLTVPGHPEVFAIGDVASFDQDGTSLPGLAAVAQQQGRAVATSIRRTVRGQERREFHYVDKGIMATVGRSRAVAQILGLRLTGFIAWVAWLFVHVLLLVGFRNRAVVVFTWFWSYLTFKRGARLITGGEPSLVTEPAVHRG